MPIPCAKCQIEQFGYGQGGRLALRVRLRPWFTVGFQDVEYAFVFRETFIRVEWAGQERAPPLALAS